MIKMKSGNLTHFGNTLQPLVPSGSIAMLNIIENKNKPEQERDVANIAEVANDFNLGNLSRSKFKEKTKNRDIQFWEAPECEGIKPSKSESEVLEFIKNNPGIKPTDLYLKLGDGALKHKNALIKQGLIIFSNGGLVVK